MSTYSIMVAFNTSLNTLASSLGMPVAWENTQFTPPNSGPYLRAFLLPAITVAAGCGTDAYNVHRGIYQVDACYPTDQGWGTCASTAESIREHFKRGTKLMAGDALVIESSWTGPASIVEGRYIVSVTINYRAYLSND